MAQTIYIPNSNPWANALPHMLSQYLMMSIGNKFEEQRLAKVRELAHMEKVENTEAELAMKGFTPHEAQPGDVTSRPDLTVYGRGYNLPQGKFLPLSIEGKTVPGKYLYTYGTSSPQVVSFPRQYTDFQTKQIDTGQGKVTVGYPVNNEGPAFEHVQVLSKPEKTSMSDIWSALRIKGLIGLSNEDQRKALFPGLRGEQEPKALRQLDIYAKSAGIDPSVLRDGSLTEEQATKITNKIIEVGDKSVLSQLMRGALGGAPSSQGGGGTPVRELDLLRKKATGSLTPDEESELNMIRGGQ